MVVTSHLGGFLVEVIAVLILKAVVLFDRFWQLRVCPSSNHTLNSFSDELVEGSSYCCSYKKNLIALTRGAGCTFHQDKGFCKIWLFNCYSDYYSSAFPPFRFFRCRLSINSDFFLSSLDPYKLFLLVGCIVFLIFITYLQTTDGPTCMKYQFRFGLN